ncbi:GNAT family N-acetyltransferase [Nocardia sp. NPDC051750]|uniref:GNAT family N-acetyltransferase n=1 Tax=Nocardia sp. NPDC051750 TaxID=3364325 RepID=UPI0037B2DC72
MSTPSAIDFRAQGPRIYHVRPDHPLAAAVTVELAIEYSTRYGASAGAIHQRMRARPAADFTPPTGDLVVLVEHGEPLAGGGFRRSDRTTAELKRVWTAREQRRRGLASRVLAELETMMVRLGYRRAFATTGDRQPEARSLYRASGYTEVGGAERDGGGCRFEKLLGSAELGGARVPGTADPARGIGRRDVYLV